MLDPKIGETPFINAKSEIVLCFPVCVAHVCAFGRRSCRIQYPSTAPFITMFMWRA